MVVDGNVRSTLSCVEASFSTALAIASADDTAATTTAV
jgi:hypothetical protein